MKKHVYREPVARLHAKSHAQGSCQARLAEVITAPIYPICIAGGTNAAKADTEGGPPACYTQCSGAIQGGPNWLSPAAKVATCDQDQITFSGLFLTYNMLLDMTSRIQCPAWECACEALNQSHDASCTPLSNMLHIAMNECSVLWGTGCLIRTILPQVWGLCFGSQACA